MKPTSYLINLARGGVVDEAALIEVLAEGRIAGAALDLYSFRSSPRGSGDPARFPLSRGMSGLQTLMRHDIDHAVVVTF